MRGFARNLIVPTAGAGGGGLTAGVSTAGNTGGTTGAVTGLIEFVGSNNITLSQSANGASATISIFGGAGGAGAFTAGMSNAGNTSGTTGVVQSQLVLAGGNNITLSQSINGQSATITISGPNTVAQSNQTLGIYASSQTIGQSSSSTYDARSLTIVGDGIISVGWSNSSFRISATTAQSNQSAIKGLGVSNTGNTLGNTGLSTGIDWVLAASGAITASQSTAGGGPDTVWFSVAAQTTQSAIKGFGASNTGNTAGNTGISTGIDWIIAGTNNITVSESTAAGGPNTLWLSGASQSAESNTLGMSNLGNTAGTTGVVSGNQVRYLFAGGNNITLSQSLNGVSGTVTISAFNQTTQSAIKGFGASNTGNTLGNTGISTGIDWVIAGTNALTVSESTVGGGPDTLWLSVPATSSIVGTDGISVATNGSTISVSLIQISNWRNRYGGLTQAGSGASNSHVSIFPILLQIPVAFSNVLIAGSFDVGTAANNSSAYVDVSASAVIYSRNASTLSSLASFNTTLTTTYSSNVTNTVTGVQGIALTGAATTLTQGEYFLAVHLSTNNTATGGANTTALGKTVSMILADAMGSGANLVKVFGAQTANSLGFIAGQGIISTGATRATIAFSDYTMTGTMGTLANLAIELRNQTWWG